MSASLLQLVQQAMGELGLPVPTQVASSSDQQVAQMMALLNACGYELAHQHGWQALTKQYTFTTTSTSAVGNTTAGSSTISGIASTAGLDTTYQVSGTGINQGTLVTAVGASTLTLSQPATVTATGTTFLLGKVKYSLPSDYDRLIDRTDFDKTKHWEMIGPETPQQWEWLQSSFISTGPRIRFRLLGGLFQIWPMITTGDVLGFEYVSNGWAASSTGTVQTSFLADTDTCIFPDRLMVLGVKLKFWQIKGFDTSIFERDYAMELSIAKANESGSKNLSMAPELSTILINWDQIPDSNYGT